MAGFFATILNYVWVFIKLFLFSAIISLPFIGLTYAFKGLFLRFNKKYNFVLSLFLCVFILNYIILIFLYFIPILSKFSEFTFLDAIGFILFHLARLIIISALFSAIVLIIGMFISLIYDNLTKSKKTKIKKKKEQGLSFFNLWKSFTFVLFVIITFVLLVFPKLPVIILYLIYM